MSEDTMKPSSKAPSLPPQADAILQSLTDFVIPPSALILDQRFPVAAAGFSDVYRATLSRHGFADTLVAVEMLRFTHDVTRRNQIYRVMSRSAVELLRVLHSFALQRMLRELKIWVQLRHPGLLPLTGFHIDDERSQAWLVSPWQPNGDLLAYLSKRDP
ncbi:hypothetical protein FRC05_004591 [Tulasnella sp. 425]|nr:hypothetical protein FRC05_004591 [Tulasnella sp. 425]